MREVSLECFDGSSGSNQLKLQDSLQNKEEIFDKHSDLIPQCLNWDDSHQRKLNLCSGLKGNTALISFIKLGSSDFAVSKILQELPHQLGESQNIEESIRWSLDV